MQGSHIVWLWALKPPCRHASAAGPSCSECGWDVSNDYWSVKWTKGNVTLINSSCALYENPNVFIQCTITRFSFFIFLNLCSSFFSLSLLCCRNALVGALVDQPCWPHRLKTCLGPRHRCPPKPLPHLAFRDPTARLYMFLSQLCWRTYPQIA